MLPCPGSLAVKNGSKIRALVRSSMPQPVSLFREEYAWGTVTSREVRPRPRNSLAPPGDFLLARCPPNDLAHNGLCMSLLTLGSNGSTFQVKS